MCTQPCRRDFNATEGSSHFFNLKDNQQLASVPELTKIGIDSLKIEGRLKSADYVAKVTKGYRMVVDSANKVQEAQELLETDLAREKTGYFMQNNLADAITEMTHTGLYIGEVQTITDEGFIIDAGFDLNSGDKLRIAHPDDEQAQTISIDNITELSEQRYLIPCDVTNIYPGLDVYLARKKEGSFASRINEKNTPNIKLRLEDRDKRRMLQMSPVKSPHNLLLFRITDLSWLKELELSKQQKVILSLSYKQLNELNTKADYLQNLKSSLIIELPKFIAEDRLKGYKNMAHKCFTDGFTQFSVSHLDQKKLLPKGATFITNENVYAFNDYALRTFKDEGAQASILPLENDRENLISYNNKSAIVPLYFTPELFFSRMPVKVKNGEKLNDGKKEEFFKYVKDGITRVCPENATSLLQYTDKIMQMGYNQFFIDLSQIEADKSVLETILDAMENNQKLPNTNLFNYKRNLR